MSKSDLNKRKQGMKHKLEELKKQAWDDPLKRNRALHEEIAELEKKLAED
ncbi:MAG: hypothetical protein V1811_02510 [Candidatus Micrarchaeota archaeon]